MQHFVREAAPTADAVFVVDSDGRIVEWDENVAALVGWDADEMIGSNLVDLLPEWRAHTVLRARLVAASTRLPVVCGAQPLQLWLSRRSGSATEIEMRIVPSVLVSDSFLVLLRVLDSDARPACLATSPVRRQDLLARNAERTDATCPPVLGSRA